MDNTLITFPCDFIIKVMGKSDCELEKIVLDIVKRHYPDFNGSFQSRLSKGNNYIALTFSIYADSQKSLDALYTDLTQCKHVVMAL